jgi:DnaJ-class molecular chaperone
MTTSQENVRAPGNSVVPQVSITDASRAKCTECRGAGFADGGSGAAYWKETCHMCEGTRAVSSLTARRCRDTYLSLSPCTESSQEHATS